MTFKSQEVGRELRSNWMCRAFTFDLLRHIDPTVRMRRMHIPSENGAVAFHSGMVSLYLIPYYDIYRDMICFLFRMSSVKRKYDCIIRIKSKNSSSLTINCISFVRLIRMRAIAFANYINTKEASCKTD